MFFKTFIQKLGSMWVIAPSLVVWYGLSMVFVRDTVYTRPLLGNDVFAFFLSGTILMVAFMLLASKVKKSLRSERFRMGVVSLGIQCMCLTYIAAMFIFVPGPKDVVVVPLGDHTQAYVLATGEQLVSLPSEVEIYSTRDMNWFSWFSVPIEGDKYGLSFTLTYTGEPVELVRRWGSLDKFRVYWQEKSIEELGALAQQFVQMSPYRTCEEECAVLDPMQERIFQMTDGQHVSIKFISRKFIG